MLLFSPMIISCSDGATPFISKASVSLATETLKQPEPAKLLLERSRTIAVRYRTLSDRTQRVQALSEMQICLRAAAELHLAHPLDWATAIETDKGNHAELAVEEFLCAEYLLDEDALLTIIRQQDRRTTPSELRLACHKALWRVSPQEAYSRARNLMFREKPRAGDALRPNYLEYLLIDIDGPLVDELLISIAAEESMEPRARSLAMDAIVDRQLAEVSPILESIFDTEATNFLIRKQALLAILQLDQQRGFSILLNKMPQRSSNLGMHTFMSTLREQYNLK
ncbi:MAG: hypothetical protein ACI84O_000109 [Myxococcota bacterium]|jgi:hypothetical protein